MKHIDWKNADWTKSNTEIAKSLQCSYRAVQLKRKELGIAPTIIARTGRPIGITKYTWRLISHINWTKRNADIARAYKLSPSRIRQLRIEKNYQTHLKWKPPTTPAIEVSKPKSLWSKIREVISWTYSD